MFFCQEKDKTAVDNYAEVSFEGALRIAGARCFTLNDRKQNRIVFYQFDITINI
jgi:hypothetical protein